MFYSKNLLPKTWMSFRGEVHSLALEVGVEVVAYQEGTHFFR